MLRQLIKTSSTIWSGHGQPAVQYARALQRFYASFTLRDVMAESSDETGTLFLNFAKHIAHCNSESAPLVPTTIRYSDFFPISDERYLLKELQRTPVEQLPALIVFAFTYRSNGDPTKFARLLNELDALALRKLPTMSDDIILQTLYSLLFLIPNWITRMDFYGKAMQHLVESELTGDAQKEKFVQLCFYLGLDKKKSTERNSSELLQQVFEKYLERHLPELSTMDIAVICNAAYKTATQVQSKAYDQRLLEEVKSLTLEGTKDALLITFIKAMRLQRIRSKDVCEKLSEICTNPSTLQQIQSRGLVHMFAYFAENLWDNKDCCNPLVDEFMQRLPQQNRFKSHAETLRGKDIAMFLWCCSQLNHSLAAADLQCVERILCNKVQNNEFRFYVDHLVDCCLSLWQLGHRSRELLHAAFKLKTEVRTNNRSQPKVDNRLTVLLAAAAIEQPSFLTSSMKAATTSAFDVKTAVPSYLMKAREDLKEYRNRVAGEDGVADAKFTCPIHGINIPSILVNWNATEEESQQVFVELQTDEQTLNFSEEPVAILRLKIQLLTALGHKVVVLRPHDLANDYTSLKDLVYGNGAAENEKEQQQLKIT